MPHGCVGAISPILDIIYRNYGLPQPEGFGESSWSVLDIGCGRGTWGCLLKAFFPMCHVRGVEAISSHKRHACHTENASLWDAGYCEVIPADAIELFSGPPFDTPHDIGLMLEVLEHMSEADARMMLMEARKWAPHWFATTPSVFFRVEPPEHFHQHVSLIPRDLFIKCGWQVIEPRVGTWGEHGWPMTVAYLGNWDLSKVPSIRVSGGARQ